MIRPTNGRAPYRYPLSHGVCAYLLQSVVVVGEHKSVVLDDLHPGSIYTFGIRCIPEIGGILSDETNIDFKMPDGGKQRSF